MTFFFISDAMLSIDTIYIFLRLRVIIIPILFVTRVYRSVAFITVRNWSTNLNLISLNQTSIIAE